MIEVLNDIAVDDASTEAELVDFSPDLSQLARPRREPTGLPRWLIASLAIAAMLTAILMLKPGPAAANAGESPAAEIEKPVHQDLFELPPWHDEPADQSAAR